IAREVAKYDRLCRSVQANEEVNRNIYAEVRKTRAMIISFKYYEMINQIGQKTNFANQASIDSFISTNPPLLNYDKTLFNEYVELVRSRFMREYNVYYGAALSKQANLLLTELNKEYDP